ncbi:MAG: Pr6Pr family membrane protein [Spirochaetales bacterium]
MTTNFVRVRALLWAVLAFGAVLVQWYSIDRGTGAAYYTSMGNFFSYFTIENNLMFGLWFLLRSLHPWKDWGGGIPAVRLSVTVYGMVTLLVYWSLLAATDHPEGIRFYANLALHLVMPLAMLGEWFFDRPAKPATWGSWAWSLLVPALYCVYSLVRGAFTGWYPYFFINLPKLGWEMTAAYVAGLFGFFLALAAGMGWVWNRLLVQNSGNQATAP